MQFFRYAASLSAFGYPSDVVSGSGRMRGPPLFTRIDFAPRIFAPSSHFFATATPAFRFSASFSARSRGALFEMCWHLVPVELIFSAILPSHRFPDSLDGSN